MDDFFYRFCPFISRLLERQKFAAQMGGLGYVVSFTEMQHRLGAVLCEFDMIPNNSNLSASPANFGDAEDNKCIICRRSVYNCPIVTL